MDEKIKTELIKEINMVLAKICQINSAGKFFVTVQIDYAAELTLEVLQEICEASDLRDKFQTLLNEWSLKAETDCINNLIGNVFKEDSVRSIALNVTVEEVQNIIREQVTISYPENYFQQENILIDLIVDAVKSKNKASDLCLERLQNSQTIDLREVLQARGKLKFPFLQGNKEVECCPNCGSDKVIFVELLESQKRCTCGACDYVWYEESEA